MEEDAGGVGRLEGPKRLKERLAAGNAIGGPCLNSCEGF
jgi:hypothetical protein